MDEEDRRWFLGVDWGSAEHWARLTDGQGRELGVKRFAHSGEGLAQLTDWALSLSGAEPHEIWAAIEVPHGPVVESLMERGLRVFCINPKQVDRFRDRFSPAGAKDDRRDTEVLSVCLRTDTHAFRELRPTPAQLVELREWSRMRDDLTAEQGRTVNQLREQLWRYYPQALELAQGDLDRDWFIELLLLVPTPAAARRLRKDPLVRLIKRHRLRRIDAAGALQALRQPQISNAPGAVEAASAHVSLILPRLALINKQLRACERRLDQLAEAFAQEQAAGQPSEQRDVAILRSSPGIGRVVLGTLLAEAWEPLQRRDYHALRCFAGTAPVTKASGKSRSVVRRRAANPRLANAVYHWARVATQHDPISRAKYAALRARGQSHPRALRAIADRLIGVLCVMLLKQTLFETLQTTQPIPRVAA